ncbi:hypothetical protein [Staphylococcus auricularis]|nr:hypothetical protein [Staphylococcus auricularis]
MLKGKWVDVELLEYKKMIDNLGLFGIGECDKGLNEIVYYLND